MCQLHRFVVITISASVFTFVSVAAFATGIIEGTITFWGDPGGGTQIEVGAHADLYGPPEESVLVSVPGGPFSFLIDDGTYYMVAFLSQDGYQGEPRDEDLVVWYDADADGEPDTVTVSGGAVSGIDIDAGFVYVDIDATGAHDGSSWADAFTNLQDGIDLAVSGVEVWAAEGTYLPGVSRSDSFVVKPGVRVCGGFTGVETVRQQRDWNAHETILSGDIPGDNSYHVVSAFGANPTAILDGVTIANGQATGGGDFNNGGGVYVDNGGVTIANSTISNNQAGTYGGGVSTNNTGTAIVVNSSFLNNSTPWHGGGFYIDAQSPSPSMAINCVFVGNTAWRGGGICVEGQVFAADLEPRLVNLSLSGNTAGGEGDGIHTNTTINGSAGPVHIENSIVWSNGPLGMTSFGTSVQAVVNYSIVKGDWAGPGTHILTEDPSFADATIGNLRLNLDSPAIDAGDGTVVPMDEYDADGNHVMDSPVGRDRDFNWRTMNIPYIPDTGNADPGDRCIDMGAYEAYDPALIFWDDFEDGDMNEWGNVVGGF